MATLKELLEDGILDQDTYDRMSIKRLPEWVSPDDKEAASDHNAGPGLRLKRMRLRNQATAVKDTPADARAAVKEAAATVESTPVKAAVSAAADPGQAKAAQAVAAEPAARKKTHKATATGAAAASAPASGQRMSRRSSR